MLALAVVRQIQIHVAVGIEAPAREVWPYLVDWERLGRWMKEGSGFTVTTPHREGVGVEAEAVIRMGGIRTLDRIRVSRWEPPDVLEIRHLGWVKGTGLMRCSPRGTGSRLDWTETLIPPWSLIGAIGMRLFGPLMRRTFRRDLHLLKALVESERAG